MNEGNSSDSENDIDYIPVSPEETDFSGESSIECDDSDADDDEINSKKKRKKKKQKNADAGEKKTKLDIDSIWAEFKRDTEILATRTSVMNDSEIENIKNYEIEVETKNISVSSNKVTTTADKALVEETEIPARTAPYRPPKVPGLMAVISQLEKKKGFNVLDKSKADWNSFKNREGISEALQAFNKGKKGYLDRQEFLSRTDIRRFEIEKTARNKRRSKLT